MRIRPTRGETRLLQPGGSTLAVALALGRLPVHDSLCLVATDLTQQKMYEELFEARRLLAEADRRKDDFLAMLGHELRNPLAAISGALQLLRQRGRARASTPRPATSWAGRSPT